MLLKIIAVMILSIVIIISIFTILYKFYFLRKPVRTIPYSRTVVSPASGRIVRILNIGNKNKETIPKGILGKVNLLVKDTVKKGYMIVIMMTPLDVHFQRSPVEGTIVSTKHSKGRFLNAVKDAGSLIALQNEKNEIIIRNEDIGKIKIVQVAGFLARRIRCFVKSKQKIHKGAELGLICLGSQVILIMPELKLSVEEGQKVIDGETVIARF
ncbi:phosphatidylserine decarboxylase [Nanoarchaeota archaeon]